MHQIDWVMDESMSSNFRFAMFIGLIIPTPGTYPVIQQRRNVLPLATRTTLTMLNCGAGRPLGRRRASWPESTRSPSKASQLHPASSGLQGGTRIEQTLPRLRSSL